MNMREVKESEERKQEFIDAAEKLFKENGIVDTTINNIVKEMNVAKGLFYYYFKSKDDIIDAISEKYNEVFNEDIKRALTPADWHTRMDQFIESCVTSFTELQVHLQGNTEDIDMTLLENKAAAEAKEICSRSLIRLLQEGQNKGYIQMEDAAYTADMITGGITYLVSKNNTDTALIKQMTKKLLERKDDDNE